MHVVKINFVSEGQTMRYFVHWFSFRFITFECCRYYL